MKSGVKTLQNCDIL